MIEQLLLNFDLTRLVDHVLNNNIRRRENYRFSRKNFDVAQLIRLILSDSETYSILKPIQVIRDYEGISYIGSLFGDRELGILGFLLREEFDHLQKAREYMADIIYRNPYLSTKYRNEHPKKLMTIRRRMFKSLVKSIFHYLVRCITFNKQPFDNVYDLFKKVEHFKCTVRFEWKQHLRGLEARLVDMRYDKLNEHSWKIIDTIYSVYYRSSDEHRRYIPLSQYQYAKDSLQEAVDSALMRQYFSTAIEHVYPDDSEIIPDDKSDYSIRMSKLMKIIVQIDIPDMITQIAREYIIRRPDRFPMYHMHPYDLEEWCGTLHTYESRNSSLRTFLKTIQFDSSRVIEDTIEKLQRIQRMSSTYKTIKIEKEIGVLYCNLEVDRALKMIDSDKIMRMDYLKGLLTESAFKMIDSYKMTSMEKLLDYYDPITERSPCHNVNRLQEIYVECAKNNLTSQSIISRLRSLRTRYSSSIHEHLYEVFILHHEYRRYFIQNKIVVPKDAISMNYLTEDIIDMFAEFFPMSHIINLYHNMQEQIDADPSLRKAFSLYVNLGYESHIENIKKLIGTRKNYIDEIVTALIQHSTRSGMENDIDIDDLVIYVLQTRPDIDVCALDYFLVRLFVRYSLVKTIEFLSETGAINYHDQRQMKSGVYRVESDTDT